MWVASVGQCTDAAIFPVRTQILEAIQENPPYSGGYSGGSFDTTVPESVLKHKRALYGLNIDEPLIAPPGVAIDVQLTFKNCHSTRTLLLVGCQVKPEYEQWSYDLATHRLLHVSSGKCLNKWRFRVSHG